MSSLAVVTLVAALFAGGDEATTVGDTATDAAPGDGAATSTGDWKDPLVSELTVDGAAPSTGDWKDVLSSERATGGATTPGRDRKISIGR